MTAVSDQSRHMGVGLMTGQLAVAIMALGWLLLAPPASGQMLLVPLTEAARLHLAARAIQGETRLVGSGPLRGSLVVEGRRAEMTHLLTGATLVLAVPPGGCRAGDAA
jgi:hypothetical protein